MGVSRNLNVTALRPVVMGSKVVVRVRPVNVGTKNALLECEMREQESGKLVCYGTHDMFNPGELSRETKL